MKKSKMFITAVLLTLSGLEAQAVVKCSQPDGATLKIIDLSSKKSGYAAILNEDEQETILMGNKETEDKFPIGTSVVYEMTDSDGEEATISMWTEKQICNRAGCYPKPIPHLPLEFYSKKATLTYLGEKSVFNCSIL